MPENQRRSGSRRIGKVEDPRVRPEPNLSMEHLLDDDMAEPRSYMLVLDAQEVLAGADDLVSEACSAGPSRCIRHKEKNHHGHQVEKRSKRGRGA